MFHEDVQMVGGDTQQHVSTDDVRQITTSDYPYGIFRLFLVIVYIHIVSKVNVKASLFAMQWLSLLARALCSTFCRGRVKTQVLDFKEIVNTVK
jgi:hypothetical protein